MINVINPLKIAELFKVNYMQILSHSFNILDNRDNIADWKLLPVRLQY